MERSTSSMSSRLSYARALRAIGQSLEAQETKNFDLANLESGFVVRENDRRYLNGSSWRRTLRRLGIRRALDLSDLHYSADDIIRLEQSGKEMRRTPAQTPDFYLLSQVLRSVGGAIDRRGLRLVELNRRGSKLILRLEQPEGGSVIEEHAISSFHNTFLGMFFERRRKPSAANVKDK